MQSNPTKAVVRTYSVVLVSPLKTKLNLHINKKKKSVRCIARFLYTVLYTDCHPASGLGRMGGGEMGDSSETRVFLGTETRWRGEFFLLLFSP